MARTRRPSPQTVAVLRELAEDPGRWRYGYDLCAELGLQAGSMYPILIRLADRGLLETSWEAETAPGKPPRHLYRLTGAGSVSQDVWSRPRSASRIRMGYIDPAWMPS